MVIIDTPNQHDETCNIYHGKCILYLSSTENVVAIMADDEQCGRLPYSIQ